MASGNPTWGEERIANELLLKIGIQISPRTVRRYMPKDPKRPKLPSQRWMTFVRNHAQTILAADFFIVVTATFRVVYVLLIMEIETRRIIHLNVTRHPTAEWTMQQFRESVVGDEGYKFIIHDRDSIYSKRLLTSNIGIASVEDAISVAPSERILRAADRQCASRVFGFHDPLNEDHVRWIMKQWA